MSTQLLIVCSLGNIITDKLHQSKVHVNHSSIAIILLIFPCTTHGYMHAEGVNGSRLRETMKPYKDLDNPHVLHMNRR